MDIGQPQKKMFKMLGLKNSNMNMRTMCVGDLVSKDTAGCIGREWKQMFVFINIDH